MAGAVAVPAFGSLVNLNTSSPFGLLGSTISTTGSAMINGNVEAMTTISTAPGLTATGMVYAAADPTAMQAYSAFESAFSMADTMASTASFAGLTTSQTFTAGSVNTFTATNVSTASGIDLTFDAQGNANAIFIVRVNGNFNVNGPLNFTLENGAQASNIFWIIGGDATISGGSSNPMVFDGNILAGQNFDMTSATGLTGTINGCVFAEGSDTLAGNTNIIGCSSFDLDPVGTPEPGTAGMVGLGCVAGILAWRKRRA
jgi:hypothetical protein